MDNKVAKENYSFSAMNSEDEETGDEITTVTKNRFEIHSHALHICELKTESTLEERLCDVRKGGSTYGQNRCNPCLPHHYKSQGWSM